MSTGYDPSPIALLATEVARLEVSLTDGADAFDIAGPCPRCSHFVHFCIHRREFGAQAESAGRKKRTDVTLNCNCAHTHQDGKVGCGAWFNVVLGGSRDTPLAPGSLDISLYEEQNAVARDKLAAGELARVRSAAASWKTGLAALFALIPTLVVVKGTDTVDKLADTDKIIVGGLIAFGAALAVTATLLALRAAYGPLRRSKMIPRHLPRREHVSEVKKTIRILNVTRLLAVVASASLAAAIAYAWASPTSKPYISVDLVGGSGYCGTLVGLDAKTVVVSTADGRTTSIPTGKVKSTAFVTSC